MNRKGLIGLSVLATVGKILAAVALVFLVARCSDEKPPVNAYTDQIGEYDYSLGKSATPTRNNSKYAPQGYGYGRNRQ